MRNPSWRIAQAIAGALILIFLALHVLKIWHKVEDQQIVWQLRPVIIVAALFVTWAMYGVLITGWRAVVSGWREYLGVIDGARIWTVSNLGTFIPGGVWAVAGMAVMAQRAGVSGASATGSAIVMQLVSLATGAVLALMLVGADILDRVIPDWGSFAAMGLALIALVSAIALTSPSLTRRIGFLVGRPDLIRPVDPGAVAAAILANLIAWSGYGLALQLVAQGTLTGVDLSWATATGAFAAAYILGYLTFFLPAGLGVRELALMTILAPVIGVGPAGALALASRAIATVNQIGAAIPFLLFRSRSSDTSQPR